MRIFSDKDQENDLINADPNNTFTLGHNKFSTWTQPEYRKLLGYKGIKEESNVVALLEEGGNFRNTVDWRNEGAVNPVKD